LKFLFPGKSGFEVAAELRQAGQYVPLLMLTAHGRPQDVLQGFDAGADDYFTKPVGLAILLARLRSLVRRHEWLKRDTASTFSFSGRTIDFAALKLRAGSRTTHLTLMEAELLRHLIRNEGKVVARRRCWKASGDSAKTQTPGPSTTSSCG
jgi:DNA-binding response OmpR family regulator